MRRYLEFASGIARAELRTSGSVDAAQLPAGHVMIDVTDRDDAKLGMQYVGTPPLDGQGQPLRLFVARVTDTFQAPPPPDPVAQAAADRLDAQALIDTMSIFNKARDLALIDQLNVIRAGLPTPLGPITPAQALAAIRAKAGTL